MSIKERWDWNSWSDLLSGDDGIYGRQWRHFITQSWLLVHFLINETDRPVTIGNGLNSYMRLTVERGEDPVPAFEAAFGVAVSELTPKLLDYRRSSCCDRLSFAINDLLPEFNPVTVKLTKEQVSLGLAENAMVLGELDRAQRWFTIAQADEKLANAAIAGLAEVETMRNASNGSQESAR